MPRKAKEQGKEAVILYYFCGHGSQYPDQPENKDENDGKDETFVAYDSRSTDFDILDDELDDLKFELRPFTSNTTLILESCHSGTGSRGDEEYVSQEVKDDSRTRPTYKRNPQNKINESEEISQTYAEIAASVSFKSAKSETKESCQCDKPMSLMTRALIEALNRATHTTTYRNLVREISTEVSKRSSQEPQVEGNSNAVLFGGKAKRTTSYIEVNKILPNKQIIINAGAIHGLKEGSQISIYSSKSLTNMGKEDFWLMNGTVTKVGNSESVVNLKPENEEKIREIDEFSHAVLTSPVFGGGGLLVSLNPNGLKNLAAQEISLHKEIESSLVAKRLIENDTVKLIPSEKISPTQLSNSLGIVRLRKGKLIVNKENNILTSISLKPIPIYAPQAKSKKPKPRENDFLIKLNMIEALKPEKFCEGNNPTPKTRTEEERLPKNDTEVYYLDDGESGGIPLFGKFFEVGESDLANKLADLITGYTYQNMLRSLDNKASPLASKVKLNLQTIKNVEIVQKCVNGKVENSAKNTNISPNDSLLTKNNNVPVGSIFRFNLKNISGEMNKKINEFAGGESFYISVIFLRSGGEIDVIYQSAKNDQWGDEVSKDVGGYLAKNPIGVEHLVVVVSRFHADFGFYKRAGIARSPETILERILTQSGAKTRDNGTVSDEPDQWGVIHLDINIVEK